VINGKSVVLHLEGDLADKMVAKRYVAQIINMGAKSFPENSKFFSESLREISPIVFLPYHGKEYHTFIFNSSFKAIQGVKRAGNHPGLSFRSKRRS